MRRLWRSVYVCQTARPNFDSQKTFMCVFGWTCSGMFTLYSNKLSIEAIQRFAATFRISLCCTRYTFSLTLSVSIIIISIIINVSIYIIYLVNLFHNKCTVMKLRIQPSIKQNLNARHFGQITYYQLKTLKNNKVLFPDNKVYEVNLFAWALNYIILYKFVYNWTKQKHCWQIRVARRGRRYGDMFQLYLSILDTTQNTNVMSSRQNPRNGKWFL